MTVPILEQVSAESCADVRKAIAVLVRYKAHMKRCPAGLRAQMDLRLSSEGAREKGWRICDSDAARFNAPSASASCTL